MLRAGLRIRCIALAATLLATLVACIPMGLAQQSKPPKKKSKPPAVQAAPTAAAVPFHSGEILEYRVLLSKFALNAAKIQTTIVEQRNFFGHPAWHFRAIAHTVDTTRTLFAIDDEFDSYSSAANLFSLQFEMYLHEQGKEQTNLYRMSADGDPAPADATAVRVLPGTRDAISLLYDLRTPDWQRTPELRVPVFDGRKLYDAIARIDTPQGTVTVPAGNFPAYRISIRLFDHGKEMTDTKFWLWVARDAAHTPVLIEAEIPFGTARIELMHLP